MVQPSNDVIVDQRSVLGSSFYADRLPDALKAAQDFATEDGIVLTLPQLVHGRVVAPAEHPMHRTWYSALSEELSGRTKQGLGVVVAVHGGGVFGTPARIEQAYTEGLTNVNAGKVSDGEFLGVLDGKLSDGEIPVYSFADFKRGITDLPRRYGVVLDFNAVKDTQSGYQNADGLKDNPLVIVRTGGVEQASAWVDKAKLVYKTTNLGNWHRFGETDIDVRQDRVLGLGDSDINGLDGDYLINYGRFVGVAPETLQLFERREAPRDAQQTVALEAAIQDALRDGTAVTFQGRAYKLVPVDTSQAK